MYIRLYYLIMMSSFLQMAQVRVPGFDFIGYGEASSKKDAQGGAAKMFCSFLVEQGLVDPRTLPAPLEVSGPYRLGTSPPSRLASFPGHVEAYSVPAHLLGYRGNFVWGHKISPK